MLHNPSVLMTYGNSLAALGRVGADVLRRTAGPCILPQVLEPVFARSHSAPGVLLPSEELMLGGVLHSFLETFERVSAGEEVDADLDNTTLIARGLRAASDEFLKLLVVANSGARRGRDLLEELRQRRHGPSQY